MHTARLPAQEDVACSTRHQPSDTDHETVKRFRRTKAEIRLGLTIEQAQQMRSSPEKAKSKSVKHGKRGKDKAITIAQAEAIRNKTSPTTKFVERKAPESKTTDLIETLSPKVQVRARAVSRYRSRGGKGVITPDMLDKIEKAISAGKVTRCLPFTGSDGFNHLTQQEVK